MKRLCMIGLVCGSFLSCTTDPVNRASFDIVPLPQEIQPTEAGDFTITESTVISYPQGNEKMKQNAEFLAEYIRFQTGKTLRTTEKTIRDNAISLTLDFQNDNKESYRLTSSAEGIVIEGASEAGVFYGIQTLRKAIPVEKGNVTVPPVSITDYPRFAYRGAHLDVARHFFPADSVKRFIDMLALHNINRFHWHLSDDQGWRIEIKKYPELTTVGSHRANTVIGKNSGVYDSIPYGGYFTQDEIRDIVAYAQKRYITVVPEIDLPGHMQAALAAYPELGCTGGPYEVWRQWGVSDNVLCAGNDKTLTFITDVLDEIVQLFPSEYIHIGGDECPKTQWAKCPKCQKRIRELGIKADRQHTAEQKLQSYVISYAEKFLNGKGRQVIGWDEILEGGIAPNATVMSWRGVEGGIEAARQGHDVVMTPCQYLYFDYYQVIDTENEPLSIGGYVPLEKVYGYEPVDPSLTADEARHVIGVQANLWTEYIASYSHVEYMELPRMAALSEIQWTQPAAKDYASFLQRLVRLTRQYDALRYHYARHIFNVSATYRPDTEAGALKIALSTIDGAPIHYTLDGTEPGEASPLYSDTLAVKTGCTLKAVAVRPGVQSAVLKEDIRFNKATMKPITLLQPINERYKYEGEKTLVDGLWGTPNYRTGRWIAFNGNALEAVVDLREETTVGKAWVRTYVEIGEEILDLRKLEAFVSADGKSYQPVASKEFPAATAQDKNGIYQHDLSFDPVKARYVKLVAQPEYHIPSWHWGKGRPAFIFVDELGIE